MEERKRTADAPRQAQVARAAEQWRRYRPVSLAMGLSFMALAGWRGAGKLVFREHVVKGIERFPEAFDMLFVGANNGKLLIEV
jgi:hypothetical protein